MPNINSPALLCLSLALFIAGCSATPEEKISAANNAMRSEIRDGSIIAIDSGSERLFEPPGNVYYVCGSGMMDSHVIDAIMKISRSPQHERFVISVNKRTYKGFGIFDGTSDPDLKAMFQDLWERRCPSYTLEVPTPQD